MRFLVGLSLLSVAPLTWASIDQQINDSFKPIAKALSDVVFYSISVGGSQVPVIIALLVSCGLFFTLYLGFINIRGFAHALRIVKGDYADKRDPGEVTHFQALATAVSGTVGVGNVAHVAILMSIGGPGAAFWMVVAGFLGMSSKFAECTLGVKFRNENPDGSYFGGPMFYLEKGLASMNLPRLGKGMAYYYAIGIIIATLGIGCMFQSNQAFAQFVNTTGGADSFFADKGWLIGLVLAALTGLVIVGGIKSIARVTSKLVPFMALLYIIGALVVIGANIEKVPYALSTIFTEAFSPSGVAGGMIGVLILGFRRAAFSNEAGVGSAAIAHSVVKTKEPVTEGYVAMLEPFIDTVVICSLTALVILVTVYEPNMAEKIGGVAGVELTSSAMGSVVSWFPEMLTVVIILFAYSTMIAWSYYGLSGWVYLFGNGTATKMTYNMIFCCFVVIGCSVKLDAVLDFSDATLFAMALANLVGIMMMAPIVKREIADYHRRLKSRL